MLFRAKFYTSLSFVIVSFEKILWGSFTTQALGTEERIIIKALITWVLTAKHGHQKIFELIYTILFHGIIIKNANLICILLQIFIVIRILNFEAELNFAKKFVIRVFRIHRGDKSLETYLARTE